MCLHKRRLIVFGGVHDEDTPEGDGLLSTFYDDLHCTTSTRAWHELSLTTSKKSGGKKVATTATTTTERADEDEDDELLA